MAARNPPLWLQAGSHPATNDRLLLEALMAPPPTVVSGAGYGIVAPGDLAVTQNGTPNMSVNVAAGKAFVDGTENANQGAYLCVNDATVNLAITASNPTNPRKDLVVAKVQDAEWSGATNSWSLVVVTGTAAASPAEPAVPANAIVLALIDIAANATSITNANITDRRRRASTLGGVVVCTSTTRPTSPYLGQDIFETDTKKAYFWNGTDWAPHGAGGKLGSARVTASQGSITGEVDLTNAAVTVTVATGRELKISAIAHPQTTIVNDTCVLRIKEGSTNLEETLVGLPTPAGRTFTATCFATATPSAGAHTYKLSMQRLDGTGTIQNTASGTQPTVILVEDMGPA